MSTKPLPLPEGWEPDLTNYKEQIVLGDYPRPTRVMEVSPGIFWALIVLVVANTFFDILFGIFLFSVNMR
jgi:hypothetical protein